MEYGHNKSRISIAISWPNTGPEHGYRAVSIQSYERDRLGGGDKKTSINVSGDKLPEQIAKDIKSRLLADAEWLYQEAAAKMNRELDYTAKKKAAVDAVAKLCGTTASERDYEGTSYFHPYKNYNCKVTVISGDSFRVEIDVNDINKVKKLIDYVNRDDIEDVISAALKG